MNIPESYFNRLVGLNEEVKEAFNRLNNLQSALDRKISDHYHTIEKNDFDIEQGFEFARQLKQTLQFRRVVKDELARLLPIYNMLKTETVRVEDQYARAIRRSYEIKESLNSTMDIEEVLASVSVEIQ